MLKKNREGLSYEHNIGLNLVPKVCTQNNYEILEKVNKNTCKTELKEYEQLIPSSVVRPPCKEILFDPQKTYKFVLFDIETSSTTRRTELLQLSAITRRTTLILRIHSSCTPYNDYRNCCSQYHCEIFWGS